MTRLLLALAFLPAAAAGQHVHPPPPPADTADPAIAAAARGLLALALENLPVDTPGQASDLIRRRLDRARETAGRTA